MESNSPFQYPLARREEVSYEYFNTKIDDPYRWLEDPDSEETQKFVDAQNAISLPYIHACPIRDDLLKKTTDLWNFPRFGVPRREGNRYFYLHNSGIQNQDVWYFQDQLDGEAKIFLDPNTLSTDGTVGILTTSFSEDGEIFAYALSYSGSDWTTIKFKSVNTLEDSKEELKKVKFSGISWTHDNAGIFYSRFPETATKADGTETTSAVDQKLYYHRIGTDQSEDIVILEYPENPNYMMGASVSDCGNYVFANVRKDTDYNQMWFTEMDGPVRKKLTWKPILDRFEAQIEYVTNVRNIALFLTNLHAPNFQILTINLENPDESNWDEFIKHHPRDLLQWASPVAGTKLIVCYLKDVTSRLQVHSLQTGMKLHTIVTDIGSVAGLFSRKKFDCCFFHFSSFLTPGIIYHIDFSQVGDSAKVITPQVHKEIVVPGFKKEDFVSNQVFYNSYDGTSIPMFVVHPKDLTLDGKAPVWLYGYGGFSISLPARFSILCVMFMKQFHGVYAQPNIRGGGEYGKLWHDNGRVLKKQNSFNDFTAAAEFLIKKKYTCSEKVCINGGSNGGLLVAACLNQRPDLFGAGVANVGVLDMLRFHKFTIGHFWVADYGNPEKSEEEFRNLLRWSPLHNVASKRHKLGPKGYPATLLLTADHDDRVVPLHSLKLIAELQHAYGRDPNQKNPLMIRVETKAGHGGLKPTSKRIEELVDSICFVMKALELKYFPD